MGDQSLEDSSLQDALEAEFCPPLETTLVAAFVADHSSGKKPTEEILRTLREQLTELAASAVVDQDNFTKDLHALSLTAPSTTTTADSWDADSVFSQSGLDASSSSASSATFHETVSATQTDSAVGFLQTLFPRLPTKKLQACLDSSGLDIEGIVEGLLSEEYVKELQERGIEDETFDDEEMGEWSPVSRKPTTASHSALTPSRMNKKRKAKGRTIAISDVLQKHHSRGDPQAQFSAGDPWSQVTSLSSYLESLLGRPSSFFQSYFHKPEYPTPAVALRAALQSIGQRSRRKPASEGKNGATNLLPTFMEFVKASPEFKFDNSDSQTQERLYADAELALATTAGTADVALDVLKLLHELEMDGKSTQEMGVYHSPVSPLPSSSLSQSSLASKVPTPVGSTPAPSVSKSSNVKTSLTPTSITSKRKSPPASSENAWQTVPTRRKPPDIDLLAAHIPAYNTHNVPRRKMRPVHPSVSKPVTPLTNTAGPPSDSTSRGDAILGRYKARIAECNALRDEALRAASQYWNNRGTRNRGGEIAFFYAGEAQRQREEAQRLQMDAVREFVEDKRFSGTDTDKVDVHYCTVSEALTIVREVLEEGWCSSARPLRVITGRGTHSSGGVAVLGPAIQRALEEDGWSVGKWNGGISVLGRASSY